jgi:hypothetical protein
MPNETRRTSQNPRAIREGNREPREVRGAGEARLGEEDLNRRSRFV